MVLSGNFLHFRGRSSTLERWKHGSSYVRYLSWRPNSSEIRLHQGLLPSSPEMDDDRVQLQHPDSIHLPPFSSNLYRSALSFILFCLSPLYPLNNTSSLSFTGFVLQSVMPLVQGISQSFGAGEGRIVYPLQVKLKLLPLRLLISSRVYCWRYIVFSPN